MFGAGYVGLVTAVGLAEIGNSVLCTDIDAEKLASLKVGRATFYEPGLEHMLSRNIQSERLTTTHSKEEAVHFGDILFVAVGTPPNSDGSADLKPLFNVIDTIGRTVSEDKVVVIKSTVPVGTCGKVFNAIQVQLEQRKMSINIHVVSNPEFLKEGTAIDDFMKPDRIVIGSDTRYGFEIISELYEPFQRRENIIVKMSTASAELTKYAANAMLAARISLMNEIAAISEKVGADIEAVRHGVGSDPRIGSSFLYAGCGYGGSCFPKDVNALIHSAESLGLNPRLLKSVERVNEAQKNVLYEKICTRFGSDLTRLTFAVWGLSFKPDTDDMRCAPSIPLITRLCSSGAKIQAYDPIAIQRAQHVFRNISGITFHQSKYSTLGGADALILVTEWKEFRVPDYDEIKKALKKPVIFDGRNQWDPAKMQAMDFEYHSIGRPPQLNSTATKFDPLLIADC